MLTRLRATYHSYPRQFWLMFWGLLISTIGSSMIWPFLMIYVSERLRLPMTATASLMTVNATMGLISSFIAGPVINRFGRKWMMVASLALNGVMYFFLSTAGTLPAFAVLMALSGAVNPLYRVGADAMMADLVSAERRADAYSLLRLSNNIGVALGPAIGGFIATISYGTAFYFAALGMVAYSLLLTFFAVETLPKLPGGASPVKPQAEKLGGYDKIFKDKPFVSFVTAFVLVQICAALVWVLLSVYTKQNYNLPESQYGLLPTTNALMVVTLQIAVTQVTKRYPTLNVLAVGALFYAVAVGSIAFGTGFWGFWLSMVVMTMGELILVPTSSTYAANQAPAEMRGRYMSIYGLTWSISQGIGPVLGGFLNDNLGPKAIWYGGALIGLVSVVSFLVLARRYPRTRAEAQVG